MLYFFLVSFLQVKQCAIDIYIDIYIHRTTYTSDNINFTRVLMVLLLTKTTGFISWVLFSHDNLIKPQNQTLTCQHFFQWFKKKPWHGTCIYMSKRYLPILYSKLLYKGITTSWSYSMILHTNVIIYVFPLRTWHVLLPVGSVWAPEGQAGQSASHYMFTGRPPEPDWTITTFM